MKRNHTVTSTKADRCYREFCSDVMMRYENAGKWSSLELDVKAFLERMGFIQQKTFWHNFKIQNPTQTGFFILDIYLPYLNLNIECDGEPWHGPMGNTDLKDIVRDTWLKFLGIQTIRIQKLEQLEEVFNGKRTGPRIGHK